MLLLLLAWLPGSVLAFTLDDLQARLNRTDALAGRFEQQRHLADLDTRLTSRGHYRYERGERLVWVLETPIQDRLEFTPGSVEDLDAAHGERRGRDQVAAMLLGLLAGDWRALNERFEIELSGTAESWQVELVPRSAALRERLTRIQLAGSHYLDRLTWQAANGDMLDVRFFDQHPPAEGEDATP
ncbi:MAG: outer membrane lipoprotein carrier protein LolA [Halomonas sp.]|nr:outer membrane lipoprotein carrier protein LolA [Halomonas sp.]